MLNIFDSLKSNRFVDVGKIDQLLSTDAIENRFISPQSQYLNRLLNELTLSEQLIFCSSTDGYFYSLLQKFKPWRKGPYNLSNVFIDAEWDCQLKMNRIFPLLSDLTNKKVLDIGCNSGYFVYELSNLNPDWVLGIDPASLYWFQFHLVNHFYQKDNVWMLPIGFDDLPFISLRYDLILCMGILYHHRLPIKLLSLLRSLLLDDGRIILETLVLDSMEDTVLKPKDRYAQMRNIYDVPSLYSLSNWCKLAGFSSIEIMDVSKTSTHEQRVTNWSSGASLANFLDPNNCSKTIEGYPAPVRAVVSLAV